MITKKIQIYNNTSVDLSPYLTAMFQYYQKHGVTLNYDITSTKVTGYQSVQRQMKLGGATVNVLRGAETLVPPTDHDIAMFVFDMNEWKSPWWYPFPLRWDSPRSDTFSYNGKPFINLGFYDKDPDGTQMLFLHEPQHALAKIFGCADQIDNYVKYNLQQYQDPDSSMSIQWAIFKPYLNTMPTIQQSTLNLIESFEGFRANPYQDIAGNWTIGIGFTHYQGVPVTPQTPPITLQEAYTELSTQVSHYATAVTSSVRVGLNQNQFDACVSLTYNIGTAGFASSTVCRDINASNFAGAADAFLLWDIAGGKVSQGLINRREKERTLFLTA